MNGLSPDQIRVAHMLRAAEELLSFVEGKQRADLDGDRKLTLAIVKDLEIIGEAASVVSADFRNKQPQVPWSVIVGMRNRLTHGYFDVNLDILWATIERDIPTVLEILRNLIELE